MEPSYFSQYIFLQNNTNIWYVKKLGDTIDKDFVSIKVVYHNQSCEACVMLKRSWEKLCVKYNIPLTFKQSYKRFGILPPIF